MIDLVYAVSHVGPQNKIDHPAHSHTLRPSMHVNKKRVCHGLKRKGGGGGGGGSSVSIQMILVVFSAMNQTYCYLSTSVS